MWCLHDSICGLTVGVGNAMHAHAEFRILFSKSLWCLSQPFCIDIEWFVDLQNRLGHPVFWNKVSWILMSFHQNYYGDRSSRALVACIFLFLCMITTLQSSENAQCALKRFFVVSEETKKLDSEPPIFLCGYLTEGKGLLDFSLKKQKQYHNNKTK